jgi:hypothetical protein
MKIRVFAFCALLPSLAAADERGAYVSLDRQGTDNAIGVAVSGHVFTSDEENPFLPDFALRENIYGRYVHGSGLGGYGQLSVSHAFGGDESTNGIGNLEVGGLYVMRAGGADVIFRLGLGLPTASDSIEGVLTNAFAVYDRLHDVALVIPNTLWIRPGVAARFGSAKLFAQVDVGVDVPIETSDGMGATTPLYHANAGVGTTQGPVTLTAELANYGVDGDDDGLHLAHSGALSARYDAGQIQPYVAYTLTFGLDEDDQGDLAHAVTAGVQSSF